MSTQLNQLDVEHGEVMARLRALEAGQAELFKQLGRMNDTLSRLDARFASPGSAEICHYHAKEVEAVHSKVSEIEQELLEVERRVEKRIEDGDAKLTETLTPLRDKAVKVGAILAAVMFFFQALTVGVAIYRLVHDHTHTSNPSTITRTP